VTTFLQVPVTIERDELARMAKQLDQRGVRDYVIISDRVKITHLPDTVPNAICTYCATANLSSSIWCVACGASMVKS